MALAPLLAKLSAATLPDDLEAASDALRKHAESVAERGPADDAARKAAVAIWNQAISVCSKDAVPARTSAYGLCAYILRHAISYHWAVRHNAMRLFFMCGLATREGDLVRQLVRLIGHALIFT